MTHQFDVSSLTESIQTGVRKNYVSINADGTKIRYNASGKTYKFTDPEELVRANSYISLIEEYQYKPGRIVPEVVVPRRTPSDSADLVIYEDDACLKPYIVIECKKDGVTDQEFDQAIEQAFGNTNSLRAPFAKVISGNTFRAFDVGSYPQSERNKNIIADIPINYGKVQTYRFKKGDRNWDIRPIVKNELIRILEKCHNTIWDGGRLAPTEAFDELSKIIFIKIRDEQVPRRVGAPYDFQIKTHETPAMVHQRIVELYEGAKDIDPDVFTDDISSPPTKLFTVVNHLQGINLSKTDLDTKGVAFERFMEDFFKGKHGQYFTPREIVRFIVSVCDVDNRSRILDPACGSGGFLLYALDEIRTRANDYYSDGTADHYAYWHNFAANNLYGIEVNDRIARVAKMNMIIHDDGHTNVICHDSLADPNLLQRTNTSFRENSFDLILTNPPFGASINKDEKPYLGKYALGRTVKGNKERNTQKTEILFIERCWRFLKPKTGRAAIILPDGILTNSTLAYVREFMQDKFEIQAIFSLPQVAFVHYGAGLKASILILRKKSESESERNDNYKVFCAIIKSIGYDATGRKTKNDLPDVVHAYKRYKAGRSYYGHDVFVKHIKDFNNNRLDPYYYSPLFDEIIREMAQSKHPLRNLEDVCVKDGIVSGKTPAKDDYSENASDPKIIKVATLKTGKVDLSFVEFVQPHATSKKFVKDGDILILSAAHQGEYLGKNPCIVNVPEELKNQQIAFVGELINIRVDKKKVNPYYLLQLLNTRNYYLLINREKRGQTSHLYPKDLKRMKVPVPLDIESQSRNARNYHNRYAEYERYIKKANEILASCYEEFEAEFLCDTHPASYRARRERAM